MFKIIHRTKVVCTAGESQIVPVHAAEMLVNKLPTARKIYQK